MKHSDPDLIARQNVISIIPEPSTPCSFISKPKIIHTINIDLT